MSAQPTNWLLPAAGFAAGATAGGLLTDRRRKGETARQRAVRVITNAVGMGLVGGGGAYALQRAGESWSDSQDPETGKPLGGDPDKKPGWESSIAARLGLMGTYRSLLGIQGRHSMAGLNTINRIRLGSPKNTADAAMGKLKLEGPGKLVGEQAADVARRNQQALREAFDGKPTALAPGQKPPATPDKLTEYFKRLGIHGDEVAEARELAKLNRQGVYVKGLTGTSRARQAGRGLFSGIERLVGSTSGRYKTPNRFVRGGKLGLHSAILAGLYGLPDLYRGAEEAYRPSAGEAASSWLAEDFPGQGRPDPSERVAQKPEGFLPSLGNLLFGGYGKDYN